MDPMHKRAILISIVFLVFAAVYLSSVAPAYNSDDSPETTLAFNSLGIQHPPGYPLNTMLGRIFTLLPAGGLTLRANMMAAFFNLLAGFFIFMIVRLLLASKEAGGENTADIAGLAAAAFYLFSASAWLQATSAKGSIYALNSFMAAACLWALLKMKYEVKFLYLFSFIYGLSLGNHWTSMAALAPGIAFYLLARRKDLNIKNLSVASAFFAAGAGVYLYVFIRNASGPIYAWGDTKTIKDFIWLISRSQYAGVENAHSAADTAHLLAYYFGNLCAREYPACTALLFIPGICMLYNRKKSETAMLVVSYLSLVLSVANVATPPKNTEWLIKPYLVSGNIFVAVFLAVFIAMALRMIKIKHADWALGPAAAVFFIVLLASNNPHYERYFIGYDFSKNFSKTVGRGSVVFVEGDMNIGAALYETLVAREKYTALIPVVLQYEWYRRQVLYNFKGMFNFTDNNQDMGGYIKSIIAANKDKNIFYSNVLTQSWLKGLTYYPEGVLYRLSTSPGIRPVSDLTLRLYSYRGLLDDKTGYDEFTKRLVIENYASAFFAFADALRNTKNFQAAAQFYNFGIIFSRSGPAYINLGLAYYYSGNAGMAKQAWQEAIDIDPYNPVAYANMAFAYIMLKDYTTAVQYTDTALKLDPGNRTALGLKASLQKAMNPR
jgi:tetratricopeptide (TPR) repeat protein